MTLLGHPKRIETIQSGSFTFQVGVDPGDLAVLLQRIDDAQVRVNRSPMGQVAAPLAREVELCAVLYTSRIEGGVLTEAETERALAHPFPHAPADADRRVINVGSACRYVRETVVGSGWQLSTDFIRKVHAIVSEGVRHDRNRPGVLRDDSVEHWVVRVGDEAHGGLYLPPRFGPDIDLLLESLVAWHNEIAGYDVPPLVRAPLVHLYFELIHPFWAGNGLVGRILEASILHAGGFRYSPFSLWRFYAERADRYFALFNECRKAAAAGGAHPNAPFVDFHLQAMLSGINRLHDRVNSIVAALLFEGEIRRRRDEGGINLRQFAVLMHLMEFGEAVAIDRFRRSPWYEGLYRRMADKTKQRDLKQLRDGGLVQVDDAGWLRLGFTRPPV